MRYVIFNNAVWLGLLSAYHQLYSMEIALSRGNNSDVIEQLSQLMLTNPSKVTDLLRAATIKVNVNDAQGKTLFLAAVEKGDAKLVELILKFAEITDFAKEKETESNSRVYWYHMMTAMQQAAKQGNKEVVDLLYKTAVGDKEMMCRPALIAATEHSQDIAIVEHLLGYVRLDLAKYAVDRTMLHRALTKGIYPLFTLLLAHADNLSVEFGSFLLMEAIQGGHKPIVETLLLKGVSVNARNDKGATALQLAIYKEREDIINLLLLKGADVNLKMPEGITALMMAVSNKNPRLIERLLTAGSLVNDPEDYGLSVLHMAVFSKHYESVRLLVEHGADLEKKDKKGLTPLHYAFIAERYADLRELFLKHGAKIDARFSIDGLNAPATLLQYTSACGDAQAVKMLLSHKADVHAKLQDTWTTGGEMALHLAAQFGHADVCRLLLEHGADLHAKTTSGWMLGGKTPLDMATGRARDFLASYQERSQGRDGEK